MSADYAASIQAALLEGRQMAESLMTTACTITRKGEGKGEFDSDTGQYDTPPRSTIYAGKCRVQTKSAVAASGDANAGDRVGVVQEFELQVPIAGTESISIGDVAEVTTSPLDGSLVGRKFTISARHEKSHATARRLRVEEVTG